jgi:hypothetical protein
MTTLGVNALTLPTVSLRRKPQSIFIIRRSPLSAVFFFKGKDKGKQQLKVKS